MKSKEFRQDINALRALSVAIVVFFHFKVPGFGSGFMGVDIFFAISGYLMTSIIHKGLSDNTFSLWVFYKARFNRLFPALAVMLTLVSFLGFFILTTSDYFLMGKDAIASAFFVSNIFFFFNSGYFDQSSLFNWFLHTWSLSVEWQFYLLYPALLIFCHHISKKTSNLVILLFVISFTASSMMSHDSKDAGYYLLHTRAWELLAGGIAYFANKKYGNRLSCFPIASVFGWIIIMASIVLLPPDIIWPGSLAIIPITGTCIILASNNTLGFLYKNKLVNSLGLWSYSIYLWHWPIVVLFYIHGLDSIAFKTFGIAVSITLGLLSFRYIESLQKTDFNKKLGISTGFLIVSLSSLVVYTDGFKFRIGQDLNEVLSYKMSWVSQRNGKCFLRPNQNPQSFTECPDKKSGDYTLLWGDSHAAHLIPGIITANHGYDGIVQRTASLCPPVIGLEIKDRPHCKAINDYVFDEIKRNPPRSVILSAFWANKAYRGMTDKLMDTISLIKSAGVKTVYIIGPVPVWKDTLPKLIEKNGEKAIPYLNFSNIVDLSIATDRKMQIEFKNSDTKYVSLISFMCNKKGCETVPVGENAAPMQWDVSHLTEPGSEYVISKIKEIILPTN